MVVLVCRCGGTRAYIYLCFLLRPVGFCFSKILHLCHIGVTKSACPTVAEKCLSTAICPYSRWRSQPLSRVSRKQRYNTLDFPTENRVPTGMLLAPIGNPEPRGYSPLDTLLFLAAMVSTLSKLGGFHAVKNVKSEILLTVVRKISLEFQVRETEAKEI